MRRTRRGKGHSDTSQGRLRGELQHIFREGEYVFIAAGAGAGAGAGALITGYSWNMPMCFLHATHKGNCVGRNDKYSSCVIRWNVKQESQRRPIGLFKLVISHTGFTLSYIPLYAHIHTYISIYFYDHYLAWDFLFIFFLMLMVSHQHHSHW